MLDLGSTVDGRDLNLLVIGEPTPSKKKVWVIARQHPGETMAEWFVEGMLDALLDPAASVRPPAAEGSRVLRGAEHEPGRLGARQPAHQRRRRQPEPRVAEPDAWNAARKCSWCSRRCRKPASTCSSTCTATKACPTCSWPAANALPTFTPEQAGGAEGVLGRLHGRQPRLPGRARLRRKRRTRDEVLTMGSPHITHAFGCLSLTLELPFKDNANDPGSAGRLGRRPQRAPGRGGAAAGAAGDSAALTAPGTGTCCHVPGFS